MKELDDIAFDQDPVWNALEHARLEASFARHSFAEYERVWARIQRAQDHQAWWDAQAAERRGAETDLTRRLDQGKQRLGSHYSAGAYMRYVDWRAETLENRTIARARALWYEQEGRMSAGDASGEAICNLPAAQNEITRSQANLRRWLDTLDLLLPHNPPSHTIFEGIGDKPLTPAILDIIATRLDALKFLLETERTR